MLWSEFKQMVEDKLAENNVTDAEIDYFVFSNAIWDAEVFYNANNNTITAQ